VTAVPLIVKPEGGGTVTATARVFAVSVSLPTASDSGGH
jgi:hypothetical protein